MPRHVSALSTLALLGTLSSPAGAYDIFVSDTQDCSTGTCRNFVQAVGEGPLDPAGLTIFDEGLLLRSGIHPAAGSFVFSVPGTAAGFRGWAGPIVGPTSFGSGPLSPIASFDTRQNGLGLVLGELPGFGPGFLLLVFPETPTSGDLNLGSIVVDFVDGSSIAGLGLAPGQYVWSWGAATSQRITLTIGNVAAPAIPEPAPWAMLIMGFGLVGAALRRPRLRLAVAASPGRP